MDVDPGIDDTLAAILALQSDSIQVEGFTVVSGNVDATQGSKNLTYLLEHLGHPHKKIYKGAEKPLTREFHDARDTHGEDGLGEIYYPKKMSIENEHAVDYLIHMLNSHPNELNILALGPLTNLAKVIQKDPNALQKAKSIRIMGGAIRTHGNCSPVAEYNFWVDSDAAQMVFNHSLSNLYLYPLDVTYEILLSPNMREMIKQFKEPLSHFIFQITQFYVDYHWEQERTLGCIINDPLIVADLMQPIVTFQSANIDIVVDGLAIGEAIADFNQEGPVQVATGVNHQAFFKQFLNTIFPEHTRDIRLMFEKGMIG